MLIRQLRLLSLIGSVAIAGACSGTPGSVSPIAPSAVSRPAAAESTGWTVLSAASTDRGMNLAAARGRKTVSGVGTIANLRGFCKPSDDQEPISFTVQGVKVVTDENTEFFIDAAEDPLAEGCGNLRNGTKVRVVAGETPNTDFSYTAEKVTIVDQPGGPPPVAVAGEGVVAALRGECPSLTMVVHGYPVMTTSSTVFEGGECDALTPGTRIKVEGVLGGNSVVADTVEILSPAAGS